jgi:drug/metabolite transporter (DMT)-like permease
MSDPSSNLRAAVLMTFGMAAFTVNDTCMKAATATLPLYQAIFLRGLIATLAIAVIAGASRGVQWRMSRRDAGFVSLRLVGEVGSTITFLTALKHMPLANLSAIMQSMPLALTLAAAVILREGIGWRRLSAIALGFLGVLLIVRPGTEGFDRWSVLGLVCVLLVVLRDLSTRFVSSAVSSQTVALCASASVTLSAALVLPFTDWHAPTLREGMLLAGAAGFLILGYLTVVAATRGGDIGAVAPFRYTALLFAIALGWAIFGTLPDALTLLGGAMIVVSGIYTLLRSRRVAPRTVAAAPEGDTPPPA